MRTTPWTKSKPADLSTPVRNRYFYGKLLDVFHFETETHYMNNKRWLLNRLVTGYGVVCGLDVKIVEDGRAVLVTPGFAIDKCGHEIIVPAESGPHPFPTDLWIENGGWREGGAGPPKDSERHPSSARPGHYEEEQPTEEEEMYLHVVLCYHECETGPTPILAGECDAEEICAPGLIEERFRIEFRSGQAPPIPVWDCHIPDAITRGELDYEALVQWVTYQCPEMPDDCCIPLANVRLTADPEGPSCYPSDVDINIRPVALSNEALFYLLMSMLIEVAPRRRR
jgi:hypothetical protein